MNSELRRVWFVAISLTIALAAAVGALTVVGSSIASSVTVRILFIALVSSVGANLVLALRARRVGSVLAVAGCLSLLAWGVLWFGYRYVATVDIGTGEPDVAWRIIDSGVWRTPAQLAPVQLEGAAAALSLRVGDTPLYPVVGAETTVDGLSVNIEIISHAPHLLLVTPEGEIVEQGYIKLLSGIDSDEHVQLGLLPHRFYLQSKGIAAKPPVELGVRVYRGKLELVRQTLRLGEVVELDGHQLSYRAGAPWLRLRAVSYPPVWIFALAGSLFVTAVFAWWRRRA